ncbi:unnamed protein product [Timema podura]|uniref:Uncharacterized protein n=1 Tax=Timema podura TaxID=61482 RepID=A0ABN7P626_TIMPD|nr:unnamed protein product [Timema podura]
MDYCESFYLPKQNEPGSKTIRLYKNLGNTLDILHPQNGEEAQQLEALKKLLDNPDFAYDVLGPDFDSSPYKTKGPFLKAVFSACLESPQVKAIPNLHATISYFLDLIPSYGEGADPITFIGETRTQRRHLDMAALFKAFDQKLLRSYGLWEQYKQVMNFFATKFNAALHFQGFDMFVYNTRGEVLEALFRHLMGLDNVSFDVKDAMSRLIRFVPKTGPGDEPAFTIISDK